MSAWRCRQLSYEPSSGLPTRGFLTCKHAPQLLVFTSPTKSPVLDALIQSPIDDGACHQLCLIFLPLFNEWIRVQQLSVSGE